jgi:hypothetical protein
MAPCGSYNNDNPRFISAVLEVTSPEVGRVRNRDKASVTTDERWAAVM